MNISQNQSFPFCNANWEQMYTQLLYSYFQLA